jgi:hypothetical protein
LRNPNPFAISCKHNFCLSTHFSTSVAPCGTGERSGNARCRAAVWLVAPVRDNGTIARARGALRAARAAHLRAVAAARCAEHRPRAALMRHVTSTTRARVVLFAAAMGNERCATCAARLTAAHRARRTTSPQLVVAASLARIRKNALPQSRVLQCAAREVREDSLQCSD